MPSEQKQNVALTEPVITCNIRFTMTRVADADTRAKLLERIVDYILKRGLSDLTLRPLATALDTSPRMLLYFFGSKEQLLTEALALVRTRQQREFARLLSSKKQRERQALAWKAWASEENEKFLRVFFEIYALAIRDRKRFPGLLERLVKDWLPFCEQAVAAAGFEPERVTPLATFILATIRGLQLDLLATAEKVRIDGAFREMLQLLSLPRPLSDRTSPKRGTARSLPPDQPGTSALGASESARDGDLD
jgi:AcrR family transcriptional regulator